MKKWLLVAVGLSFIGSNVWAAKIESLPPVPEDVRPKAEMKMRKTLAERLNLTDEQREQADKIREEGRVKMKPLIEEQKELHKQMNEVRKANLEEFEKILTPEQKKAFDEMKKHKRPHPGMRPGPKGPKPGKHHRPKPLPELRNDLPAAPESDLSAALEGSVD